MLEEDAVSCEVYPNNKHHKFTMLNSNELRHVLEETDLERDLGIYINNRLTWGKSD
jgi:hypothetical protein